VSSPGPVLFVIMSLAAGVGAALWFGIITALQYGINAGLSNAFLGVVVFVLQLVPALIVTVLLSILKRRRWSIGYFTGPLVVVVVATAYCGVFYLLSITNSQDPFGPVIGMAFLTTGLPVLVVTHCLGLLVSGLLFGHSPEMQRLLGRVSKVVPPTMGPAPKD
jgi:hypothetical protein